MQFFHDAAHDGYSLIGLFTYEGPHASCVASCGAVYFAGYVSYQFYKRHLADHESSNEELRNRQEGLIQAIG